jgi:hypothetical protein
MRLKVTLRALRSSAPARECYHRAMRTSAAVAVLLLAVLASGCVDYTEDTTLHADGSARISVEISMKDVLGSFGRDDSTGAVEGETEYDDGSGKTWTEHKDGLVVRHIEGLVKDFRQSGTLQPQHTGLSKLNPAWYSVTPLGFGRYRLQRTLAAPSAGQAEDDASGAEGGDGNPLSRMGESFARTLSDNMLAGHQFSVTLPAPLILSSNADVKDGLTSATWKRPLNQLVGSEGKPLTIDVTVLLVNYWLAGGIGGGVLLLLILWGVLAARGRRARRSGSGGMPTSA